MVAIKSKINVLRALSSVIAKKAISLFAICCIAALILLFVGIFLLAYFLSAWWWLLLVIFVPLLLVAVIFYFIATVIASRLAPTALTREQTSLLNGFTDKVLRLLETRGMGWWWFCTLCIRDLVFYRELRTLKTLLKDTTSLKKDFQTLENELS